MSDVQASLVEAMRLLGETSPTCQQAQAITLRGPALMAATAGLGAAQATVVPPTTKSKTVSTKRSSPSFAHRLEAQAQALNNVTDRLNEQIATIEASLKKLGLGVTAWVYVRREYEPDADYAYSEELGYCKIGTRWCIAIRSLDADVNDPDGGDNNLWQFSQAPREFRIRAAEFVPKLMAELSVKADEMLTRLSTSVVEVQVLANAMDATKEAK